jgi:hypothetical protein
MATGGRFKLDFSHLEYLMERHRQTDWEMDSEGLASVEKMNAFQDSLTHEEKEEWMVFQISRMIEFRPTMSKEDDEELMDLLQFHPEWAGGYMTYMLRICNAQAKEEEIKENEEEKEETAK